jgi:dTMP kinase
MSKKFYPGKFIVFEGLDGSGQSTQTKLLAEFLEGKNYKVLTTKEPTLDSRAGKKIRQILDEKTKEDPAELQKLFAQDRQVHLNELIIPRLKEGKIVISDRYFYSTFAFGYSDGLDLNWLIKLNEDFLAPDIAFILKVAPKICVARIEKRGKAKTLFEKEAKLVKVWEGYEKLAKIFKEIKIINGEKSIPEVFEDIKKEYQILKI